MKSENQKQSSAFLTVLHDWESYFQTLDEGLGTTYERFILHRYFRKLRDYYAIERVLEAPSFGMTGISGINSLWWAKMGAHTVVVDDHRRRSERAAEMWRTLKLNARFCITNTFEQLPFEDQSFDLSWNFAALWFVSDLRAFANELQRLTQKVIFICVPNTNGLGYKLRWWFSQKPAEGFYPEHIKPRQILRTFGDKDWRLSEKGYLDIPPWPDIAMKKEDLLDKLGLGFLLKKATRQPDSISRTTIFDYFNGRRPNMESEILKYAVLENAPFPVKQLWGHHRYYIFTKR